MQVQGSINSCRLEENKYNVKVERERAAEIETMLQMILCKAETLQSRA